MNRSSAALSDPPTLLWVTIRAVMTAQNSCGSPSASARAKVARLEAVIRKACTSLDRLRESQPDANSLLLMNGR